MSTNIAIIHDEVMTCSIANRFGACIHAQVHRSKKYVVGKSKYPLIFAYHISTE
jgi:hypothetical protein